MTFLIELADAGSALNLFHGIKNMNFVGKKIAVIGAGVSGVAASNLLQSAGALPFLSDTASEEKLAPYLAKLNKGIPVFTGRNVLDGASLVVVSPGISPAAPVFAQIKRLNLPLWGEVELAYRFCKAPLVAITGTDGKSTVTEVLGQVCKRAGINTFVGGNIGNPLCDGIADVPADGVVVAEISCFQAVHLHTFRPRVGLLLNIAEDHIDYHGSMDAYVAAKFKILENCGPGDTVVLNRGCAYCRSLADITKARPVFWAAGSEKVHGGVYLEDDYLVAEGIYGGPHKICKKGELTLPGEHNVENMLAVSAAGLALGIKPAMISDTLKNLKGLPGRIETVGWANGVQYINDTKATNPHAAIAGLRSFDNIPVVLIAGGVDKGLELEQMAEEIAKRCKAVILLGAIRERMARAFSGYAPMVLEVNDLESAVRRAAEIAVPGDVVLLGPACSSFDMFKSYAHRGSEFVRIVQTLSGFKERE